MHLEIVSPEAILFSSEVSSIYVPGTNGEFEMLNNHAPIVSVLKSGKIEVKTNGTIDKENLSDRLTVNGNAISLEISSGTLELNDNKAIILVD